MESPPFTYRYISRHNQESLNCTYLIKLRGQVNEGEVNIMSPIQITVKRVEAGETLLSICSDQSGLVGLLSFLNGVGYLFLSVNRIELASEEEPQAGPIGQANNPKVS